MKLVRKRKEVGANVAADQGPELVALAEGAAAGLEVPRVAGLHERGDLVPDAQDLRRKDANVFPFSPLFPLFFR